MQEFGGIQMLQLHFWTSDDAECQLERAKIPHMLIKTTEGSSA